MIETRHSWVSTACDHVPPVIYVSADPLKQTEKSHDPPKVQSKRLYRLIWEKAAGAHGQSFVNEAQRAGCNHTRTSSGRLDLHLGRHRVRVRSIVSESDASGTLAPHPAPVAFPSRVRGHLHLHLLLLLLSVGLSQTHSMISLSWTRHTLTITEETADWLQEWIWLLKVP